MAARKAVPKRVIAKMRDEKIQIPIRMHTQEKLHQSKIPFGELRNIIADTLERTYLYRADSGTLRVRVHEGRHARVNAEAEAEIVARALMYEDSGFPIREEDIEIPYCKECDE